MCLVFGGGCIHVHTDADGKLKSINLKAPQADADGPKSVAGMKPPEVVVDHDVKPAAATIPAQATASIASLAKLGKGDLPRGAASEMCVAWQNKVAYLPDPTKNGDMIPGVVGQMFLFAPGYQSASANGKLTIEMFDETSGSTRLGGWTLDKDTLKKMVSKDERFGRCYTLFLPWPDYKGQAIRLKMTARYEGENSYPLYAIPSMLTIDPTLDNTATIRHSQSVVNPGSGPLGAGFQNLPGTAAPAQSSYVPALSPLPIGVRSATGQPTQVDIPTNLPPLVITSPSR